MPDGESFRFAPSLRPQTDILEDVPMDSCSLRNTFLLCVVVRLAKGWLCLDWDEGCQLVGALGPNRSMVEFEAELALPECRTQGSTLFCSPPKQTERRGFGAAPKSKDAGAKEQSLSN